MAEENGLGWRAALTPEYQEHEFVKGHAGPNDFVKWAIEGKEQAVGTETELTAAKTRLESAIFKPGENATEEEKTVFRKALDVPEGAGDYEFPVTEGIENDPRMVTWAQGVFHKVALSKEQAGYIGGEWNKFRASLIVEEEKEAKKERAKAEGVLKEELKTEEAYKEGVALISRLLGEVATPEEITWLQESKMGDHPVLVKLLLKLAKKTGEDDSPPGRKGGEGDDKIGFAYNESPAPPTN